MPVMIADRPPPIMTTVSIVTAVAVEQLPRVRSPQQLLAMSETLKPGTEDFKRAAADLKVAEEHSLALTPLMFRDLKR